MGTSLKTNYVDTMHALCPYFAMFPPKFARDAISKYSEQGDLVVDPFSGRGTTLLEARLMNRVVVANDINPVAVAITRAKTQPLDMNKCLNYIGELENNFKKSKLSQTKKEADKLPEFFKYAYNPKTLLQILWLRKKIRNVVSPEGAFIKTLAISHLHGETQKTKLVYFSNNLPHTYCPKPDYSIQFWKDRKMKAPKLDIFDILKDRCRFRLVNSSQHKFVSEAYCIQGDVRNLEKNLAKITDRKATLVVTSPPYIKTTSYEEDQWLRLWFLGGPPYPRRGQITKDDQINSISNYIKFLGSSLRSIRAVMKKNGTLVCRIGESPRDSFPIRKIISDSVKEGGNRFKLLKQSFSYFGQNRQSVQFGKKNIKKGGEYDFILRAI